MKLLKSIWFLLKLSALGYGIFWLVNRPGTIDINWQGWVIETSVGFVIACLIAAFMITAVLYHWWRRLVSLPKAMRNHQKARQTNKGFEAVTRGLLAVAAGDEATAIRQAKKAQTLLEGRPLTKLLNAQAALMKGDDVQAREHFNALLEDPEGAFFGVRGLLTSALHKGDTAEALQMARQAYEKQPKRAWIIKILFDLEAQAENWQTARDLLPQAVKYDAFTKQEASQNEAAILIAQALNAEKIGNLKQAVKNAKEAQKKAPDFVPTITTTADLLIKENKKTAAEKLIQKAWQKNPHPDLADFWYGLVKDRLPLDQVKWAEKLIKSNPEHVESRVLLAKAAMNASLWGVARTQLTAALKNAPTQRIYQMLSTLEKKENNDDAQAHNWLTKMVDAPADAKWVCQKTGTFFEQWHPICPTDHSFNSIQWKVPTTNDNHSENNPSHTLGATTILPPSVLDIQKI